MDSFKILFKIIGLLLTGFIVLTCTEDQTPTEPHIDYISPLVEWLYPPGGSELSGVVELRFSVYDEGGIDSACVYINGSLFGEGRHSCLPLNGEGGHSCLPLNCVQTASVDTIFSLSWNTLDFADGVYILEARAWDEAGNLGTSPSLVVNVRNGDEPPPEDRMPPDVWWTAPNPGSTLADTVRLRLGVFDEVGVDSVLLLKNGAAVVTIIPPYYCGGGQRGGRIESASSRPIAITKSNPPLPPPSVEGGDVEGYVDYLWDTTSDSDGVYVWEARAWDASGNMGTSPALLVRVKNNPEPPPEDHTPPVVSWCSPEPGDTLEGTVELRFQVLDDVGVDSVKVYLNGREWQNLMDSDQFFDCRVNWITSEVPDGNYIVEVRAWDSSGNMGIGVGVVFTVWNNRPRVIWVPDDFEKIQDAIWNSENGDTIMVRAGEYHEQLQFFDKNVSLVSESGPEETIIDGRDLWSIVWLGGGQDSTMLIRGFTFYNPSDFQCYCFSIDGIGTKIVNNIFSVPNTEGYGIISGSISAQIRNNLFIDIRGIGDFSSSWGDLDNNMIIDAYSGLHNAANHGQPLIPDYNLLWNVSRLTHGSPMGWGEHNIDDQEPIFIKGSYRLREGSPGIDKGRPDLRDPDGSRSDIGVYGGPYAYPIP